MFDLKAVEEALGLEHEDDLVDDAAHALLRDINSEIRVLGRLVGVVDTSEALDLAAARLGVDAALVGLLAVLERSVDVDQEERAGLRDGVAGELAGVLVGSNWRGNARGAGAGELAGDEGDALDVGVAVLAAEAELRGQLVADGVTQQQGDRAATLLVQSDLQSTRDSVLARVHIPGQEDGETLSGARRVGLAQDLDHLGVGEPLGDVSTSAQTPAELGAGDVHSAGARGDLVAGLVLVGIGAVRDLLEGHNLDAKLFPVLLDELLGVVRAVDVLALRVLTGTGVVTADDEVSGTVILPDDGVPQSLTGTTHAHGQGQETQDGHAVGVAGEKGLVGAHTGEVVNVTGLGETDNGVNQDVGLTSASSTDGQLTVSTVHGVSISLDFFRFWCQCHTSSGKQQLGSSRACRSESAAPRGCLQISIARLQIDGLTSRGHIVVVVQLVDGLDLATNVELLGDVVQVLDGGVIGIAAKDVLGLLRPVSC